MQQIIFHFAEIAIRNIKFVHFDVSFIQNSCTKSHIFIPSG